MSVTIRSPSCGYVGKPDVAITRLRAPVAVVVQVLVADHIMGDVSRRARILIAPIPAVAPVVKIVGTTKIFNLGIQPVCPLERPALASMQGVGLPVAG
jgi:hypothetical protein